MHLILSLIMTALCEMLSYNT